MSEQHIEEGLDNTTALSYILETGDVEETRMILGTRDRVRPAGIIRPGIKLPVGSCSKEQKELYERMLDDGHGFDAIDAEMLKLEQKNSTRKSCLRPANCGHFIVRPSDFRSAADCDFIQKNYAGKDGLIREIPIWLTSDSISLIAPHNFRAFDGGGNLRCVSEFHDDGKLRFRYLPKGAKLPAKPEDWKILDSEDEDEATKACGYQVVFGGMLRFFVPGVRSAGDLILPTRSWNGLSESIAVLRRVKSILGRCSGLLNGQPFLALVKTEEDIKHEGKRGKQWIPSITLTVDPMELARYAEPHAVTARAQKAMSALTGRVAAPPPAELPPVASAPVPVESDTLPPATTQTDESSDDPFGNTDPARVAANEYLHGAAKHMGVSWPQFSCWAQLEATDGVAQEDLTIDELRTLANNVKAEIKKDKPAFAALVKAKSEAHGVE
jgi:hypothetical protein